MPSPLPRSLPLWSLLLVLVGCAHTPRIPGPLSSLGRAPPAPISIEHLPPVATPHQGDDPVQDAFGTSLADAALHYLDVAPPSWRGDCSSFVCAAASRAGLPLTGNTRSLFELADSMGAVHHRKVPEVGDLAFFDDTYDRNRNGRPDDDLTHVAVVISVDADGTIVMAHAGTSTGRTTLTMNLEHPDVREADGKELNGFLRRPREDDTPGTPHLAGECWRAFATLDR